MSVAREASTPAGAAHEPAVTVVLVEDSVIERRFLRAAITADPGLRPKSTPRGRPPRSPPVPLTSWPDRLHETATGLRTQRRCAAVCESPREFASSPTRAGACGPEAPGSQ